MLTSKQAAKVFRDRLINERMDRNLTQVDVAKRCKMNQTHLGRLETGVKGNLPNFEILRQLCLAFGVSADYLLGLDVDKMPKLTAPRSQAGRYRKRNRVIQPARRSGSVSRPTARKAVKKIVEQRKPLKVVEIDIDPNFEVPILPL